MESLRILRRTHFGIDRIRYVAKKCLPTANFSEEDVRRVVQSCPECQSIDPSPVQWEKGSLSVDGTWERLAMDVTHYGRELYLTIIDCGPSRFAFWRRIREESAEEVCRILEEVFLERGPPIGLLMDNSRTFRSDRLRKLCIEWKVNTIFRCVNKPSGNGIVERNHRTVKRMASRSGRPILEMVFWYNFAPKDGTHEISTPSSGIYSYKWRCPEMVDDNKVGAEDEGAVPVGTKLFVKPPDARCTSRWSSGEVTGKGQTSNSIEVDGLPRHISDVRLDPSPAVVSPSPILQSEDDRAIRQSDRIKRSPAWMEDFVMI